jgi:hypothetical protein
MVTTEPETLQAAHDDASRRRPKSDANPSVWLAFHLANARMYRAVAGVDRWHHHEATYWAGYEERKADEFSAQLQEKRL